MIVISVQFAVCEPIYPAVKYASSDFNPDTGLIYQGLSDKEHIYLNNNSLSIQGKQKGSVNLIDFDNDGKPDIFTTGFYLNKDKLEIASTELHKPSETITGVFPDIKYSSSCWADFDNNGLIEPAMTGEDNDGKSHFDIFRNNLGIFELAGSLPGLKFGDIKCGDVNKDGWIDLIACGQDENGRPFTGYYENKDGVFQLSQSFDGLAFCAITMNDFNQDGYPDTVIGGENGNYQSYLNMYTFNGLEFVKAYPENITPLKLPKLDSGDFNNDGLPDIALSGSLATSKAFLMQNNGNVFEQSSAGLIQAKDGAVEFMDYNHDNQLELFITGAVTRGVDEYNEMQLMYFRPSVVNNPPSTPSGLSYEIYDNQHLKLSWNKSRDDHSRYLFYHARAGTSENPNQFLSGYLGIAMGNAQEANFKYLKNPCLTGISSFIFQARAIDTSMALSEWSEPYTVNCIENTTEIEPAVNTSESNTKNKPFLPVRWSRTQYIDKLKYYADYELLDDSILVTEIITNQDIFTQENISVIHPSLELLDKGIYTYKDTGHIEYSQKQLLPGHNIYLNFRIKSTWPTNKTLPVNLSTYPVIPSGILRKEINVSTSVEGNNTIVVFEVKANDTHLLEKDVAIIQTLPKCLIETINEMAIKSGRIKSNRQFKIIEEDPVIMWSFDTIVNPEQLRLEINAVADENCRNHIRTQYIAKTYLARNTPVNYPAATIQFLIPILLFLASSLLITYARKTILHGKIGHIILLSASVFFLATGIMDMLQLLPVTVSFSKTILSWISVILIVVHLDLARILTGQPKGIAIKSHLFFNLLLITSYLFLSFKNVIFVAYDAYGEEFVFYDLLMLIIKYAAPLENILFFIGSILLCTAILFAWFRFPTLFKPSESTQRAVVFKLTIGKLFLIAFLILGFYTAIFQFLFDWFSISIDSPFLLLLVAFSCHSLMNPEIEEESITQYLRMLPKNSFKWITLSIFPVMIFTVEAYLSVFHWLTGSGNLYLNALDVPLPTLWDIFRIYSLPAWGICVIQAAGLIALMIAACTIWAGVFTHKSIAQKNSLFSLIGITGMVSFFLNPAFDFIMLNNNRLSGVLLVLKQPMGVNLILHYIILIAVVFTVLIFRNTPWAKMIHYFGLAIASSAMTVLFLLSYLDRTVHIFYAAITDQSNIITVSNSLLLIISATIYAIILFIGLYAWSRILLPRQKSFTS